MERFSAVLSPQLSALAVGGAAKPPHPVQAQSMK